MGASADYEDVDFVSVTEQIIALLTRADFTIRYPENLSKLCCGMAFSSKGFRKQAAQKAEELMRLFCGRAITAACLFCVT